MDDFVIGCKILESTIEIDVTKIYIWPNCDLKSTEIIDTFNNVSMKNSDWIRLISLESPYKDSVSDNNCEIASI